MNYRKEDCKTLCHVQYDRKWAHWAWSQKVAKESDHRRSRKARASFKFCNMVHALYNTLFSLTMFKNKFICFVWQLAILRCSKVHHALILRFMCRHLIELRSELNIANGRERSRKIAKIALKIRQNVATILKFCGNQNVEIKRWTWLRIYRIIDRGPWSHTIAWYYSIARQHVESHMVARNCATGQLQARLLL